MLNELQPQHRIMLVIHDPATLTMVGMNSLEQAGYEVHLCVNADIALQEVRVFLPQIIILDQRLPDLSGRDLMVALQSAGVEAPILQLMAQGDAHEIIQAYRLGARDVLLKPFRETELFAVLDRLMDDFRLREERLNLEEKLREANYRLANALQEMQSLMAIQKTMQTAKTEQEGFTFILEVLMQVSEAHRGWMIVQETNSERYVLAACRNMPANVSSEINKVWVDKLSQAVIESGSYWMVNSDDLKKAGLSRIGASALVMPIKVQEHLIGVIALTRKSGILFEKNEIQLINAAADFIAMALLNSRLYSGLKQRNARMKNIREEAQSACAMQLSPLVQDCVIALGELTAARTLSWRRADRQALKNARAQLQRMREIINEFTRQP